MLRPVERKLATTILHAFFEIYPPPPAPKDLDAEDDKATHFCICERCHERFSWRAREFWRRRYCEGCLRR